jgi:hypothetical protein
MGRHSEIRGNPPKADAQFRPHQCFLAQNPSRNFVGASWTSSRDRVEWRARAIPPASTLPGQVSQQKTPGRTDGDRTLRPQPATTANGCVACCRAKDAFATASRARSPGNRRRTSCFRRPQRNPRLTSSNPVHLDGVKYPSGLQGPNSADRRESFFQASIKPLGATK